MSLIQTYTFWQLLCQYAIEIPIIQRDYAQGRNDRESSEIRGKFLDDIIKSLIEEKPLELDFVFGKVNDDTFVPIDGQQRLTTLFLLHWYIVQRNGNKNVIESFNKLNFTYKTRISARDFTTNLINAEVSFDETNRDFLSYLKLNKIIDHSLFPRYYLSFSIRNASWFFRSWETDPTVKAMLVMLDEIHYKLWSFTNLQHFWDKLTTRNYSLPANNPVLNELVKLLDAEEPIRDEIKILLKKVRSVPVVSFKLLNLDDFQLTDDLYLKMNARGRPLNNLENFKAWLIGYVAEKKIFVADEDWAIKFDKAWTDLFWQYKDEEFKINKQFMRFINGMLMYSFKGKDHQRDNVRFFFQEPNIPLSKYEALQCFRSEEIDLIGKTLDWFHKNDSTGNIVLWLSEMKFWQEKPFLRDFISDQNTYANRVLFYANVVFARHTNSEISSDPVAYARWIRVVRNLVAHTTIDSAETFIPAINSLTEIGQGALSIFPYLVDSENIIQGFLSSQINEERLKAELILENELWEAALMQVENHGLFHGSIGFLLSGNHLGLFKKRSRVAIQIFSDEGVKQSLKDEYLFIRAMLAISKINDNVTLKDNGQNWRDLLKKQLVRESVLYIIDNLSTLTESEYIISLRQIIESYNDTSILWRFKVIKNKVLLSGRAKDMNISKSNIIQQKYGQNLYYLFNNEGGNWINNDNQILLSNVRNDLITHYLSVEPNLKADNTDAWWLFSDHQTGETFYRGFHIWLHKSIEGKTYKLRYQFMPQDVIFGIHNDHEGTVLIVDNNLEKHHNWQISIRLSFGDLKINENISNFINSLQLKTRELETYLL